MLLALYFLFWDEYVAPTPQANETPMFRVGCKATD
jgi:hypothetical protein